MPGATASPAFACSPRRLREALRHGLARGQIGHPGGVRQKPRHRDVLEGGGVEFLEVLPERRVQVHLAHLPQPQDGGRGGHHLGERGDVEDGVGGHQLRMRNGRAPAEDLAVQDLIRPGRPRGPRPAPPRRRPSRAPPRPPPASRPRAAPSPPPAWRRSAATASGARLRDSACPMIRGRRRPVARNSRRAVLRFAAWRSAYSSPAAPASSASTSLAHFLRGISRPLSGAARLGARAEGLRVDRSRPRRSDGARRPRPERGGLRGHRPPGRHHPRAAEPRSHLRAPARAGDAEHARACAQGGRASATCR